MPYLRKPSSCLFCLSFLYSFFVSTCIACSKPNDNKLNEVRQPPYKATSQPLYQEGFLRHTTYFTLGERSYVGFRLFTTISVPGPDLGISSYACACKAGYSGDRRKCTGKLYGVCIKHVVKSVFRNTPCI